MWSNVAAELLRDHRRILSQQTPYDLETTFFSENMEKVQICNIDVFML